MTEVTHALLAIRKDHVAAICGAHDDEIMRECLVDWAMDPEVSEIIRVPIEVARKSFEATADEVRSMLAEAAP